MILDNIVYFNNKSRRKTKDGKDAKRNTLDKCS